MSYLSVNSFALIWSINMVFSSQHLGGWRRKILSLRSNGEIVRLCHKKRKETNSTVCVRERGVRECVCCEGVCVYVCEGVVVCVYMYMQQALSNQRSVSTLFPYPSVLCEFLWRLLCFILFVLWQSLTESEAHRFGKTSWPGNFRDSPVLASPALGIQVHTTMPGFLCGYHGSELKSLRLYDTCLTTEPSS